MKHITHGGLPAALLAAAVLASVGCDTNHAPDRPPAPSGPATGRVGEAARFQATGTDQDGGLVALRLDWDNGDTSAWTQLISAGDTIPIEYAWSEAGEYKVSAQVKDDADLLSPWSDWFEIVIEDTVNLPPGRPNTPAGPDTALVDSTCDFWTAGADPNGDRVSYQIDWGDGDTSDWGAYVGGGTEVTMYHAWHAKGEYQLAARSRDEVGLVSGWSDPHGLVVLDSLP